MTDMKTLEPFPETEKQFEEWYSRNVEREGLPPSLAAAVQVSTRKEWLEELGRRQHEKALAAATELFNQLPEGVRATIARLGEEEKRAVSIVLQEELRVLRAMRVAEAARKDAIDYLWGKVRPVANKLAVDRRKARELFLEALQQTTPRWGDWDKNTDPQKWEVRFRERGLVPPAAEG
jgi:hypothetical protein